jgi:hypothetical protein
MTEEKGLLGSVEAESLMKILTAVGYKDGMVYARQIAGSTKDIFLWDAVWQGQLYSSYIVVTHEEGVELTQDVVDNARDMCYAGAAATIDFQRGEGLTDQEKAQVELFEANRLKVEKMDQEEK